MLDYLLELRRRSLQLMLIYLLLFVLLYYFANDLLEMLLKPLIVNLSPDDSIIVTSPGNAVITPLKVAADTALLLLIPFALIQFWYFVTPALYQKERRFLVLVLTLSMLLFLSGLLFCFYLVLPFMFSLFAHTLPTSIHLMPDMAISLGFIIRMLMIFGLCFQIPLLSLTIIQLQIIDLETLKKMRPYYIVFAFIIGMLLTPPDVLSQIMLALPLCLLFELGIALNCYLDRHRKNLD